MNKRDQVTVIDALKILEMPIGSTMENIKKNYRKLAMIYHPDKNKNDKVIMKKLEYIVNNKDLNGDLTNTSNKVLRYERLSYLWKYSKSKPIIRNYIENLIEITRTIIDLKKLNKKIPFSNIYDGHRMLGEKRAVRDLIKNITTKY
ncbi:hypothetical protein LCGC14_1977550 [marine sediment metagenome]|uniref:J domain-containing protein n=1 Tax=marine sediment metagenome TaxID=412755 RepID=A0A0F9I6W1_9ZZZZ